VPRRSGLDDGTMSNYHVTRCEQLINNPSVSNELRMVCESLVAMASGIDDADSMAQQALERIDICLERIQAFESRLSALESRICEK
jgi:hypothetical protein